MPALHEVVAVVQDRKQRCKDAMTTAYQLLQKPAGFSGLTRSYRPTLEGEIQRPAEIKRPEVSVENLIKNMREMFVGSMDTVRTQDEGNMSARGDINASCDGKELSLVGVPATHLLYLQKIANDILTIAKSIPVLDPSEEWSRDQSTGQYRSTPGESISTRKVPKPIVKYAATAEHPAQTELFAEDIPVGVWSTVKLSAAVSHAEKHRIVTRATALVEAVKQARQRANATRVEPLKEGEQIFDFVFGG